MTAPRILVCTVGGSDAPVVTALRNASWDFVVFVCTDDSAAMITDAVVEPARPASPAKSRPSIPAQAGIDAAAWSTLIVPADNPDDVYARLTDRLAELRRMHPGAQVTVDFTGGTKSMSAGAVLAVASGAGGRLQVTTGQRSDLLRVLDGTQQPVMLDTQRMVLDRQIDLLRETWRTYGYQEAARGFHALLEGARAWPELHGRLEFWKNWGERFAAWDRFDRKQAASNIRHLHRTPADFAYTDLAERLWKDSKKERDVSALLLCDLLRNAERCAARGRYDDAVARCYRLWEWTAQWLLQAESEIRTGDVDPRAVPPDIVDGLSPNKNGRYRIASKKAWEFYRWLHPAAEAAAFWGHADATGKTHEKRYEELGQIRNNSILAHGAKPVGEQHGRQILDWTAGPFMAMVVAAARRLNEPHDVPQLPTELPEPEAAREDRRRPPDKLVTG